MSKNGPYKGKIIDNVDPKTMGRIKVRVRTIHDGVADEDLPWAAPKSQSAGKGSIDVPTIGEEVYIEFPDGDFHEPQYTGNVVNGTNLPDEFKVNYPNRKGFKSEHGFLFYRDESNGEIKFSVPAGMEFDVAGAVLTITIGGMSLAISGSGITMTGGDIIADGISLKEHVHGGISPGGSLTDVPQ